MPHLALSKGTLKQHSAWCMIFVARTHRAAHVKRAATDVQAQVLSPTKGLPARPATCLSMKRCAISVASTICKLLINPVIVADVGHVAKPVNSKFATTALAAKAPFAGLVADESEPASQQLQPAAAVQSASVPTSQVSTPLLEIAAWVMGVHNGWETLQCSSHN